MASFLADPALNVVNQQKEIPRYFLEEHQRATPASVALWAAAKSGDAREAAAQLASGGNPNFFNHAEVRRSWSWLWSLR